jgi:hypothetical protein
LFAGAVFLQKQVTQSLFEAIDQLSCPLAGRDPHPPFAFFDVVIWCPGKPKIASALIKTFPPRNVLSVRADGCPH